MMRRFASLVPTAVSLCIGLLFSLLAWYQLRARRHPGDRSLEGESHELLLRWLLLLGVVLLGLFILWQLVFIIGTNLNDFFQYGPRHVLKDAEAYKYQIITSTLTIAEVHKRRGWETLTSVQSVDILDYLENDFITYVELGREISEE